MTWRVALFCLVALGACQQEELARPDPVEMTPEAVGYYCQMALLEHEGPKGQIHLGGMPAPIFFSQVRDAIAYLHMPEQSYAVTATYVQDMSKGQWSKPGDWIRAEEAFYVIGSDARGGMGAPELVPFSDPEAAEAFIRDHGGRLSAFTEITAQDVLSDDVTPVMETSDETDDMAERLSSLNRDTGN